MAVPLGEPGLPGGRCFDLIIMTCTPEGFRATGGGKSDICCVEIAESSINTMMTYQGRGRKIKKNHTEKLNRVKIPLELKNTLASLNISLFELSGQISQNWQHG